MMLLGGALASRPVAVRAQQRERSRRMGVLMGAGESDPESQRRIEALRQGLAALGWREGDNLKIEWRWGGGDVKRMSSLAAELVALGPDLIIANGAAVLAALQQQTRSIPLVFVPVNDPVSQGFIASLAHPGGNTTGFTFVEYSMVGKALELLNGLAPGVSRVAFMFNPDSTPYYQVYLDALAAAPRPFGIEVIGAPIHAAAEIDGVITQLARQSGGGLFVPPDVFTIVHRDLILRSAAEHRVPAIYSYRQFVHEGGLMSYGPDTAAIFRRSASYVDRILKGANPAELPVQTPDKFDFAINLETAKTLGLTVPPGLLAIADEVVE